MFSVGEIVHGFKLLEAQEVAEYSATMFLFEHEKSGARLIWFKNGEDNKLFSIAFKTIPENDTGVFHILEHSVLNGSKKYPLKEPFVELLKSSMNTFLNAMTFPDKTVYPVSSRNQKDFENLMNVYLDAVFCPSIYTNPNIFYQEGWHYEVRDPKAVPVFKGVVFNEMKGAFASVDSLIDTYMSKYLFKDSCYGYCSGGNPLNIPDLSYEEFIEAHKRFYHPSNSYIYLDGDLDIEAALRMIDEGYLSHYERKEVSFLINTQVNQGVEEIYEEYAAGEDDGSSAMLAFGRIIGDFKDKKKVYAAEVLNDYLFGNNDAPLKKKLLSCGLMKDAEGFVNDGIYQPYLLTVLRNIAAEDKEKVEEVYQKSLKAIGEEGIDHKELYAALNQFELRSREKSEPKGLYNNINVLSSWLYDGDPKLYLCADGIFDELRGSIEEGYFEQLFDEMYLEDSGLVKVLLKPSLTKDEEDRKQEKQRLETIKSKWSEEQLKNYIALNENLDKWQNKVDSREDLKCLPVLNKEELSELPFAYNIEESVCDGVRVLYHPHSLPGITYLSLYFSLNDLNIDDLACFGVIEDLLGSLPTVNYSVSKLQYLIKESLGCLSVSLNSYRQYGDNSKAQLYLTVAVSCLNENINKAIELVKEVVFNTKWSETALIKELLVQNYEFFKQRLVSSGHTYAIKRAMMNYSADGLIKEKMDGYSNYRWLKKLIEDDDSIRGFALRVEELIKKAAVKNRLCISLCSDKLPDCHFITDSFTEGSADKPYFKVAPDYSCLEEAIEIPSGVNYVVKGACLPAMYEGSARILAKIITFSYLWNEVRVKGGAYGTGLSIGDSGCVIYYSYRDPASSASFAVYDRSEDYFEEFLAGDEEIDKFIISTIADFEPLLNISREASFADSELFSGMTYEMRTKERKEMLNCRKEDLKRMMVFLKEARINGSRVLSGNKDAIEKCGFEVVNSL